MPSATATLTAIMSLESPRPAPGKSLTVVLDAGIYVPSMGKAVIAALRFFNDQGLVFDENGALYFVTAKVAKMKKGVETLSDGWVETDYDLIGDIIQLIKIEGGKKSVKPKHHQPLVQVAGTVESGNPQAGYFQLTIPQWITADNSAFLPVKAQIPLESKWKDRSKVIPEKGGIASFVGHLTDVERDSQTDMPTRFVIEVSRHLDFLGRSSSHSSPSPSTLSALSQADVIIFHISNLGRSFSKTWSHEQSLKASLRPR
ncbi:hypothetical protein BV25DRAFT_1831989 [Artomyces pyxidatus]|uniref:Uncharacterized protein n=1 Tax=Artomyces pyxidatus TaxID=48021 RepID=A0ACB8SK70_9AGAM|nr:hypothetical protein BV25DRAFT_1831989 [Artomyces pyxidatus]